MKKEVNRLIKIGLLTRIVETEWAASSFVISKKDGTIRFLSDFRGLKKFLKRKPYPLPLIMDIMQSLGAFKYATTIDLNMGYYTMTLDEEPKIYCVTILPWGILRYNMLPMGILVACDIFQSAMGTLFQDLEHLLVYLDDLITLGIGSFDEHLAEVDEVLSHLIVKAIQVNFAKSAWAVQKVACLGFLITRDGFKPQTIKVQVIVDLKPPSNQNKLRGSLGMVNFYKNL